MRSALLALLLTAACGRPYEAGSFEGGRVTFEGGRGSAGCLDLAIDAGYEKCPEEAECPAGPVATIAMGNRCHHAVTIDLEQIVFVSRPGQRHLRIADPNDEIHPADLDGRARASERFELIGGSPDEVATMVCANLSRITEPRWKGPVLCSAVAPPPPEEEEPPDEQEPPADEPPTVIVAEASL